MLPRVTGHPWAIQSLGLWEGGKDSHVEVYEKEKLLES